LAQLIYILDQPDAAFTEDDEKNMFEIYQLLSKPSVALPDVEKKDVGEKWDAQGFMGVVGRWPEGQRFPCKLFITFIFHTTCLTEGISLPPDESRLMSAQPAK
jgi:hypothetical protein